MASPPEPTRRTGRRTDLAATALLSVLCLFAATRRDASALRPAPDAPALTAELTSPGGSVIIDADQTVTPCLIDAWNASRSRAVTIRFRDVRTGAVQALDLAPFTHATLHFSSDAPVGPCREPHVTFGGSRF